MGLFISNHLAWGSKGKMYLRGISKATLPSQFPTGIALLLSAVDHLAVALPPFRSRYENGLRMNQVHCTRTY